MNDDRMFNKFLDMLCRVQFNLPLFDVLHEIPIYAKYIKEIVENKIRFIEFETMALTEECISITQKKLQQYLKDPGSFAFLVRIDEVDVRRALCDLEESIYLMPLSVFSLLGVGYPKPTIHIVIS